MNDLSKSINIDKSSLISLKAELLKKKEEAKQLKSTQNFIPKKLEKPAKEEKPAPNKPTKEKDDPDDNLLAKSKEMLAKKSKFYEHMMKSASGSAAGGDDGYLVMFDQKKNEDLERDEELVEYTDCLGRTRQVTKAELNQLVKSDKDLYESAETRKEQFKDNKVFSTTLNSINLGEKFQEQRENWEKQDEKNTFENFVHYQDLLYNEAREHGVGYYEFSTDSDRRKEQMEALEKIRKETLESQKKSQDLKSMRDKIISDRVNAARLRVRQRTGVDVAIPETKTSEDQEKPEEREKSPSFEDLEKERLRRQHVRPWDKHKTGKRGSDEEEEDWRPKKERVVMDQETWNQKQRLERKPEFAPTYVQDYVYEYEEPKKDVRKFSSRSYKPSPAQANPEPPRPSISDNYANISYDYPPEEKRQKLGKPASNDLEKSIEAGLKFLRQQTSTQPLEKQMQNKNKWSSKQDY
jgi:hypothetical protein